MLPIVGGSAAGSRLGSGRDLPFSFAQHFDYDDYDDYDDYVLPFIFGNDDGEHDDDEDDEGVEVEEEKEDLCFL